MAVENAPRVLVVEDDTDLCALICQLLSSEGYQTLGVHDGETALAEIDRWRPDAVILDVMLRGTNGFDICQRLKISRRTNAIAVLMLTAGTGDDWRQRGLRVGADVYLTKPFASDELFVSLKRELSHRADRAGQARHTSVVLQMQSDSRHREQLNDMLGELLELTPLTEEQIWRLRYAVLEMIENAIEWGNRRQKDLTVTIEYEVSDHAVRIVITDQGGGFDPTKIPHAACADDPLRHLPIREKLGLRDGGFGILTARGLVDEFAYNSTGNQVTLVKRFARTWPT